MLNYFRRLIGWLMGFKRLASVLKRVGNKLDMFFPIIGNLDYILQRISTIHPVFGWDKVALIMRGYSRCLSLWWMNTHTVTARFTLPADWQNIWVTYQRILLKVLLHSQLRQCPNNTKYSVIQSNHIEIIILVRKDECFLGNNEKFRLGWWWWTKAWLFIKTEVFYLHNESYPKGPWVESYWQGNWPFCHRLNHQQAFRSVGS